MVNRVAARGGEPAGRIVVDVERYRERRLGYLEGVARRLAEKARQTGHVVTMNPMSPRDRRIVHLALQDDAGVSTRSQGEGVPPRPDRPARSDDSAARPPDRRLRAVPPQVADVLHRGAETLGVALDMAAEERIGRFVTLLSVWNRRVRLTAESDPTTVVARHVVDSLAVVPHLRLGGP